MKPFTITILIITLISAFTQAPISAHAAPTGKYFDYLVTILMENNDLQTVLAQGSFEAAHANQYTLATGYSAISHPSEPNYVTLLGGSVNGITSDGVCCFTIGAPNIVDRLEAGGLTWKAF